MSLHAWVHACQPQLVQRVRGPLIEEWTRDLAARLEDGHAPPERLAAARVQLAADRAATELLRAHIAALEGAWDAADPPARRALIDTFVADAGDARLKGVRRVLQRDGDLNAVREHGARLQARAMRRILLGLAVVGRGCAGWIAEAPVESAVVLPAVDALIRTLDWPAPWFVHDEALIGLTAIEAALSRRNALTSWPPLLGVRLMEVGRDVRRPPAVRVRALTLATREPGAVGLQRVFDVLQPWLGDRYAFVLRRAVLEGIFEARPSGEVIAVLTAWAWSGDPSEHVRVGVAEACGRLEHPDLFAVVERLAGLGDPREPSPKVRALAGRALLRLLLRGAPLIDRLLLFVARESAELPLVAVCEALRALATDLLEVIPTLLPALIARLSDPALNGRTHEAIAAAVERLDRALDPRAMTVEADLGALLARLEPGQVGRLRVDPAIDDDLLGRILAAASRRDFGLSARRYGRWVIVRRGDLQARRLWRILHEGRRPAPTKRVGQLHTVGRVSRGALRAPPGLMDEVTPTEVPGERVHVQREGDWGRALPLVDDLLDLPLLRRPTVRIYSSFGITRVRGPKGVIRRLLARGRMTWRYARLAELRLTAHRATEPHRRASFVEAMRRLGFEIEFQPYLPGTSSPSLRTALEGEPKAPVASLAAGGVLGIDPVVFEDLFREASDFALSWSAGEQPMLSIFLGGLATAVLGAAALRYRGAQRARARIPLTIGGWGTRGKSGTERLKSALLHGLGYDVFVKTTGCEAVLMHSVPGQRQEEILLYRPYDRASIWEHERMMRLAADLGAEVFLWECMALRTRYVEVLQHDWMHDDFATLTNAYPDHEDVQGPAGQDVARTLSQFIPRAGELVTAEINFLPIIEATARARGTRVDSIDPLAGALLADDLLDLFPYAEHPRNIALTVRLGEALGIDPNVALLTMAQHVVADLGVLRFFPPVRVAGRTLIFVNGMSANERAGFLNNWARAGLDDVPVEASHRAVLTVVNNRADRIPRSQVFARLLVEEVAADGHVLIGTNLEGLVEFIEEALDRHLEGRQVMFPGDTPERAMRRLHRELGQVRVPPPRPEVLGERLRIWLRGLDLDGEGLATGPLTALVAEHLGAEGPIEAPDAVRRRIASDGRLARIVAGLIEGARPLAWPGVVEVLAPAAAEDVQGAARRLLAQLVIARRAERAIGAGDVEAGNRAYRAALRGLFLDSLRVVEDPGTSGDSIIEICARHVPPGVEAHVMGIQNIKGTGLDFIYRLQALQTVHDTLAGLDGTPQDRLDALGALAAQSNPGLLAAGIAVDALEERGPLTEAERIAHQRALAHMKAAHAAARVALGQASGRKKVGVFQRWTWGLIDWLDAIGRARRARQILGDLSAGRISHPAAADAMLALNERQKKGPWG